MGVRRWPRGRELPGLHRRCPTCAAPSTPVEREIAGICQPDQALANGVLLPRPSVRSAGASPGGGTRDFCAVNELVTVNFSSAGLYPFALYCAQEIGTCLRP